MKRICKSTTVSLITKHQNTLKQNTGCHNRQPFSFANISWDITCKRILLQIQISHPMITTLCFTNQTENPGKSLIKLIKTHSKTHSYHPSENGGIILYSLLVAFYIGVERYRNNCCGSKRQGNRKNQIKTNNGLFSGGNQIIR